MIITTADVARSWEVNFLMATGAKSSPGECSVGAIMPAAKEIEGDGFRKCLLSNLVPGWANGDVLSVVASGYVVGLASRVHVGRMVRRRRDPG